MKAITIKPQVKGSIELREAKKPEPKDEYEVLVKVLEAGICRTDLEIYNGLYGEAPEGEDHLIMGHESIGIVESAGLQAKLEPGDYIARTVRRPCPSRCYPCGIGSQDFCRTGNYTETGIKGLHGTMAEYYTDRAEFLVKIPTEYKDIGVLMEPLSFAEKAVNQAFVIQKRLNILPTKAMILGAGPIGLLEAMILRNRGVNTYIAARSKPGNLKSRIAERIGAKYISTQETNLKETGKFDIVIESTGSTDRIKDSFELLGTNGVLCLTSITAGNTQTNITLEQINMDFVLGNKAMVGAVNANINDYKRGIRDIEFFEKRWPGAMASLITRRVSLDNYKEAFEKRPDDIKTLIELFK